MSALSGTDNGNFTFSGSAVANVMFVSGTVNGKAFSLFGYFDKNGTYTGIANSIAVFDYQTLDDIGLLVKQQDAEAGFCAFEQKPHPGGEEMADPPD